MVPEEQKEESFDVSLDFKDIKNKSIHFFKKYGIVFLILIPLLLSIYVRMIPANLPITDDWAKQTVDNYYKTTIKTQLKQQYPNLPDQNLNTLIDQQYADFTKQNSATVQQQIAATSQQFKAAYQDENGYTYMPDIDPYQWLRYARNYLNHGYVGDEIKNGVQWDNHMLAPVGTMAASRPHPIVLAYLYKIMHAFNSKITLMQSATYFPVILCALAVIPVFFLGSMIAGSVGGFFAAIVIAINGALLGRTSWGHADTDAYNIFFPVYFIWFFFLTLNEKDTKKKTVYSALGGISIALFSLFWAGWWYAFDFVVGAAILYGLYLILSESSNYSWKGIKENHSLKEFIMSAGIFFIAAFIIVSLVNIVVFHTAGTFTQAVFDPITFTQIKVASNANNWPNVYTTVAELNSASYSEIIGNIGGNLMFYLSILGIALLIFTDKESRKRYMPYALLIALWYAGIFYASNKGIRFIMMLAPAIALAIGAAIGIGYQKIMAYVKKIGFSPKITAVLFIAIMLLMFYPQVKDDAAAVKQDIPLVNDAWYNSLNKIGLESAPNAIINSWWDFGHHFKYIADRAVTFDGASQNTPMAHWIGKVLLTSDENVALGTLRMLDCGSNTAFEKLNEEVKDVSISVDMLNHINVLSKTDAQMYLQGKKISQATIDKVLPLTHCNPPEDYFITSEDMVSKAPVWAHFGSWNFDKADIWIARDMPRDQLTTIIEKQLNVSPDDAKKIYFQVKSITNEADGNAWIAPWPGYSQEAACSKQGNTTLSCSGVTIDLATKDVQIGTDKGVQRPHSLVYAENGEFKEKVFDDGVDQSMLLIPQGDSYRILLASPQVATSMFTRLFYYEGVGAPHFKKFSDETDLTGQRIIVWKVVW